MDLVAIKKLVKEHREATLLGRYITSEQCFPLLIKYQEKFNVKQIGKSVLQKPIHVLEIGNGAKRILMWSQMHGNESTTTKAIFDLCKIFADSLEQNVEDVLEKCTIAIIPILNPDGAKAYTRMNANGIDLNRDAQALSEPESQTLRTYFNDFTPHYCFNLHDQRTIFSAGNSSNPATISFLAPAQDKDCTVTKNRRIAMEIIVRMNESLQKQIPNQVGIYDDAFNINCVGDTFQSLNVPTILFEAGHFAEDYNREAVRELIVQSLIIAIEQIATQPLTGENYEAYAKIPLNQKLFYDVIIRDCIVNNEIKDIAIRFQEKLDDGKVRFSPIVEKISDLDAFCGHKEYNANGGEVLTTDMNVIYEGYENDFVLINNEQFALKS